jgi:hypothetical protein
MTGLINPMHWLWKNKVHLVIWAVFIIYLLTASQIYAKFFLKNGKPLPGPAALPAEKGSVQFFLDDLSPYHDKGETVFMLTGWVFSEEFQESGIYQKKIVLHSSKEDLIFPTEIVDRPDVAEHFSSLHMDLVNSGFRVFISKDVLKIDNYRIGFLLEDANGDVKVYRLVDQYIQREPNGLRPVAQGQ